MEWAHRRSTRHPSLLLPMIGPRRIPLVDGQAGFHLESHIGIGRLIQAEVGWNDIDSGEDDDDNDLDDGIGIQCNYCRQQHHLSFRDVLELLELKKCSNLAV
jgi:hypothetical protein